MASTSSATPSQSTRKLTYDVFLSFRGEDIRKTFLDHLNYHLKQKGIYTFKDDEKLKRGECIAPTLLQAIKESRIAIVIFSEDYASSTWCLDEVATIIECKEKLDQVVVPIFYHVEPSNVRKQTGNFAESFAKHEERFKDDEAKVKRWRKALTEAASIKGHDLKAEYNEYELTCIEKVVDDIFKQLHPAPSIPKNLVGLESLLEGINTLMEVSSQDVKLIGIWGMGGIGKTTIARVAFAKFSSRFDGACFLADIREKHSKEGMEALQATLLKDVLKVDSMQIRNVYQGIEEIKTRLNQLRVFIVLDDVDSQDQLEQLAGDGEWLCNGSRLIITTRDKHLFTQFGVRVVVECYEVEKLDEEKALKLFSLHAFKKESPENGFYHLSTSFVRHASGLPLALKVWGSFLCGRTDREVWESTLEKIKDIPDEEVIKKLRISYDGLDENCKKVFLDIACFFRHKRWDYVEDVLKGCKLHPVANIMVLIDRCLLFESYGRINMHDLIHEMGLSIERENRSRRWRLDHLDDEPKAVEGLLLSFSYNENISPSIEAFKQMKNLKMLIVEVDNDDRYCSKSLESYWTSIMDYLPRSLVVLKFPYYPSSKLYCTKDLMNLTYLDLSLSSSLLKTPNFVKMPNLERLYLSYCDKLKEMDPSVGNLKKLVLLNLRFCINLEKLPSFNQASSLKFIDFGGCSKLENFPEIKASTPNVVQLDLKVVGIRELPSSIQRLHGLTKLCLDDCEHLIHLSNGLCELKNLKVLEITRCSEIKSLPENLERLILLEYLNLRGSGFFYLPESFSQLPRLQYLDITSCRKLKELPKLPASIEELYADCRFAFGSNVAVLAIKCSKLYSLSFTYDYQFDRSKYLTFLAKEFIHFPFHRKTPFCVSYESDEEYFSSEMKTYMLRSFEYQSYMSNRISINLNRSWYSKNFVGFVASFFPFGDSMWGPHSYQDIDDHTMHGAIIVKLSHKDNGNEVLQTECMIARSSIRYERHICFAYIPFSSLWPEPKTKMDSVIPNDYSRLEVEVIDGVAAAWGCSLLY